MTDAVAADFLPILSAAASPDRWLVVSVHDVAPQTHRAAREIVAELKGAGVPVTSLLVVPDHHGRGKAIMNDSLLEWLRGLEGDGHEIVIHGYFHQRPRRVREAITTKLLTRVYSADEAEFFDLEYEEALTRIMRARDEFREARLSPVGFIAPGWLLGAQAQAAARDAGMQYTALLSKIVDLLTGASQPARSLVYSTRARWRRPASLAWNALLARGVELRQVVRLSIHPGDFAVAPIRAQILRLAAQFASTRAATTYRDWIAQTRSAS